MFPRPNSGNGCLHGRTATKCLEPNVANDLGLGVDLNMEAHHITALSQNRQSCANFYRIEEDIQLVRRPSPRRRKSRTCRVFPRFWAGSSL